MQPSLGLFFSMLLTTGTSLECEICNDAGENCHSHLQKCSDDRDVCAMVISETSLGLKFQRTVKYCEYSRFCSPGPSSLYMGEEKNIRSNRVCCVGNKCSDITLKMPKEHTIFNGKRCPVCYSVSEKCSKSMVDCLGTHDYCFETTFHAAHDLKNTTMKGCTTKSVCNGLKRKEVYLGGFAVHIHKIVCKAASKSPPSTGYAFLALFGFLLKILF